MKMRKCECVCVWCMDSHTILFILNAIAKVFWYDVMLYLRL